MKTEAYIIRDGVVIAKVVTDLKSGTCVKYGYCTATNALHADKIEVLINAQHAKISRSKKYNSDHCDTIAKLVNHETNNDFIVF